MRVRVRACECERVRASARVCGTRGDRWLLRAVSVRSDELSCAADAAATDRQLVINLESDELSCTADASCVKL